MDNGQYQEAFCRTDRTKLAAAFRVFGGYLRKVLPLEWNDVFRSKADYFDYLEDTTCDPPKRNPRGKPKHHIFFNFEPGSCDALAIEAGFYDEQAEDKFAALLQEYLTGQELAAVLSAHSRAVARACHEALLMREDLASIMNACPQEAKWDTFNENGRTVKIGKTSSPELKAEFLAKL